VRKASSLTDICRIGCKGLCVFVALLAIAGCSSQPKSFVAEQTTLLKDFKTLSSDEMEGRASGTAGNVRARAYILERLNQTGVQPAVEGYLHSFEVAVGSSEETRREFAGANLLGVVQGTAKNPGNTIVLTAHYDHLGQRGNDIYNGADDNASGVAALLALASHFTENPPENTFVFAFLDAEEYGLLGAKALVKDAAKLFSGCLAFNVNMDMISRSDANELYVAGSYHNPSLKPFLNEIVIKSGVKLLQGHDRPEDGSGDWTLQSDHGAFHKAGVPFLYFGVEDHKDYHKPTDTFEAVPLGFYTRGVETIGSVLTALDQEFGGLGLACSGVDAVAAR